MLTFTLFGPVVNSFTANLAFARNKNTAAFIFTQLGCNSGIQLPCATCVQLKLYFPFPRDEWLYP